MEPARSRQYTMDNASTPSQNATHPIQYSISINDSLQDSPGSNVDTCSLFQVLYFLDAINVYYIPIIIVIGSVLNIIACVTLRKTKLSKYPISHYLAAKCVADTVFLVCLGFMWATQMGLRSIQTNATCPYLWLASQMSNFLSVWLVVAMCLERNILVSERWFFFGRILGCCGLAGSSDDQGKDGHKPHCTVLKSQITIIAIVILGVVVYVNISHTIGAIQLANTSMCAPLPMFLKTSRVLYKFDIIINVIIPYLLVLLLNIFTWKTIVHLNALRKGTIAHRGLDQGTVRICPKAEIHLTKMVVIYTLFFVLLTFPTQSMRILHDVRDSLSIHTKLGIREYLWQYCMQIVFRTSFAVNFFIILGAHRTFRKALRQLLRSWFYRLKAAINKHRQPHSRHMGMEAFQFTVEFSSTLVRLKETNLG